MNEKLKEIEECAFSDTLIEKVFFPTTLEIISNYAFEFCNCVFVEDGDIKKASFRLYGIDKTTLTGYSNYTYDTKIFSFSDNNLLQTR